MPCPPWEQAQGVAADLFTAAVVEHDFEVHLGLAAQAFDVGDELPLVGANRPAEGIVVGETQFQNGTAKRWKS
jgi:hypothetical protein